MSTERKKLLANPIKAIEVAFSKSEMVDGGGATGTYTMSIKSFPAGAQILGTRLNTNRAWTGDTSQSLAVGTADDVDGIIAGKDILAAKLTNYFELPADNVDVINIMNPTEADDSVLVFTVTSGSDFTLLAGDLTIYARFTYVDYNAKSL